VPIDKTVDKIAIEGDPSATLSVIQHVLFCYFDCSRELEPVLLSPLVTLRNRNH
jgi:hypothetical protein